MKFCSEHSIFQLIKGCFDSVHIVLYDQIYSRSADSVRKWSSQLLKCTLIAHTCMDVTSITQLHPTHMRYDRTE